MSNRRQGSADQPLPDRIFVWHLICGFLIALIVALHIAGALYHRLVKGDRVLQRLLPGIERWPTGTPSLVFNERPATAIPSSNPRPPRCV
jgi:hypothetical protein